MQIKHLYPPPPPPVGVDPRMVVNPGIYIPPDFAGDPNFIPILRVPGVDPDPGANIPWLERIPKPTLRPLPRALIKILQSPLLTAAELSRIIAARGSDASLAEIFLCSEVLGARNRPECKLIAGITIIGNLLSRGLLQGPIGRFIFQQRGFVFPKPSVLRPARTRPGPTKPPLPFPGVTLDDLGIALPPQPVLPDVLAPVETPPMVLPPMPELPVRPDLAPITAPPTVAPRPAEIPVQTPGPLVSPQPGRVSTKRAVTIPKPSLGTKTGRVVLPGRSLLTDFLFGVAIGGLSRSLARQRVEAPVRDLVDLVRTPSPVGSVTPLAPPALVPFTQPLMQRARTAQQDCVEVKRRRRRRGKCKEGFYEELPGRTRFTPWREVNCRTGKTIKEFR